MVTNLQVTNLLLATALDCGAVGYDEEYGFGRIDVVKALAFAASGTITTITYPGGVVNQQLQLTSYAVVSKTKDTGVVAWVTNMPATGRVRYGTTAAALSQLVTATTTSVSQQATITGLDARKKYFYQIEATTASGTIVKSPVAEFSTKRQ